MCRQKDCTSYGKSVNHEKVHKLLEEVLKEIAINPKLYKAFEAVLMDLSKNEQKIQINMIKNLEQQFKKVTKQIEKIQARILEADDEQIVSFYEVKLKELFVEKATIEDKKSSSKESVKDVLQTRQEARQILENPLSLWEI